MKSPYYDYVLCGGKAKELCQIEGCCWWFVEIVECYVDGREADGLGFYAFPACQWQLRALLVRMERPPAVAAGVSMECLIALQFEGRYICYFLCCFHEIVTLRSEASVVELAEVDLF